MSREELVTRILATAFLPPDEFTAAARRPAELLEGSVGRPFGKYLVIRKLGEGGFGKVFLAVDPGLNRPVALKVLKRAAPQDLERFRREARAAAAISHPNIVPVYEVGRVGGEAYLAMSFVDGSPAAGRLDVAQAARVVLKVGRALGAAHRLGLIHRDVKPQNILLDRTGEPFLTDFGMAKQVDGAPSSLSQSGSVLGTPAFMSPEQARGEQRLGPATDVFSLGATLYFLIAGESPFEGESVLEILRKVVETRPAPPPGLDPSLKTILMKAMAYSAHDRYPTAAEMADDLERYFRGERVSARRFKPLPWGVAAAACGAVVAAAFLVKPSEEAPAPLPKPPPRVVKAPAPEPAAPAPREVDVKPAEKPTPPPEAPPPAPPRKRVDPALKARVFDRVLGQPDYYRRAFLPESEELRAREILSSAAVSDDELAFLTARVLDEVAPRIEAERRYLAAAAAEREPGARQVGRPDVIEFTDGRRQEVRLLSETETAVKYLYQEAAIQVPRDIVRSVARGASAEAEFVKKLDTLRPGAELELAAWCRERAIERQREYTLYRGLERDPANVALRRELGLPHSGPLSTQASVAAAPEARGKSFTYEGKVYSAEELKAHLLRRGYVILDGQWCAVRPWRWSPGAYWKGGAFRLGGRDVAIQSWKEARTETVFDVDRKELVEVVRQVPRFHYVGPKGAAGTAEVEVEAPHPFLDGKVKASSAVTDKGSVEVLAVGEGRDPVKLYSLAGGTDRSYHDLGELPRGLKKFTILARLESGALFLPGDAQDAEPLVVQGRLAEPVPALNALLPLK